MFKNQRGAGLVMIGAALAAGLWSIRIGFADYQMRRETVGAMEKAIALAPDNAEYYARLAWLESDAKRSRDALGSAVALNPWDAGSWIELGLRAEAERDDTTAERSLLRAAEVDRTFLPRWTLANYYFRRHDEARFWVWIQQAAAMAYGDARPLFRLCGQVKEDGTLIDRLDLRNPELRAGYLAYLLDRERVDLTGPAVQRVLEDGREGDAPLLIRASGMLRDAGRGEEAAGIWNRLKKAGWAEGEHGQLVADERFALAPGSAGVAWQMAVVEGISVAREEEAGGLRVTLSGREPEDCEVLAQLIPLEERTKYQLSCAYRTRGIGRGAGLDWRVTDANGGAMLGEGPSLASETGTEESFAFDTPPGCRFVRLALRYHRAPGTIRVEGFLTLRRVAMTSAAQSTEGGRVIK